MPARKVSRFRIPLLLLTLAVAVPLLSRDSRAFDNPSRYYDWGPSSIRVNPRILGAQTESTDSANRQNYGSSIQNVAKFSGYLFGLGARLQPDSPFYFVKTFQENLVLTFTPNPTRRQELRLQLAGRRLEELEKLSEEGKTNHLSPTSQAYSRTLAAVSENLDDLRDSTGNAATLLQRFEEEGSRHLLILEQISLRIPDAAREGIERALASSESVVDRIADLEGKPALPVEVLDRIQALKAQGLLAEEEAGKLVSAASRAGARAELKKYAAAGIFPEADISKLNEFARERFRNDFDQLVEYQKFFELKRLEEQRPDEEVIEKVQEFAKTYRAGDLVPADLRRYWVPMVRLEELQNTIRPDLIDPKIFGAKKEFFDKFQELVERTKPRPEDLMQLGQVLSQNPSAGVDPFYERILKIAEKFGATCGANLRWTATSPTSGYCAPKNINPTEFTPPTFQSALNCGQALTPAKNADGVCVVFPNACLPPTWTKTDSCAGAPSDGYRNQTPADRACPTNSHWAAVPYLPEGGYCVPNITYPVYEPGSALDEVVVAVGVRESVCPDKFHRNYPGGPCLPDTYFGPRSGYATYTPGLYPSPAWPPAGCPQGYTWTGTTCLAQEKACGFGTHWDPEARSCTSDTLPYSPKCGPGEYSGPNGVCTASDKSAEANKCASAGKFWTGRECLDKAPEGGGGVVCPENQVWDDKNKACSSGGYGGVPNPNMGNCRTPGECYDWCQANPDKCQGFREDMPRPGDNSAAENCYRSGRFWNGSSCLDRAGGGDSGNTGICPSGQYRGPGGYCISSYSGGTGGYSPSAESQEAACRTGGGTCVSWVNNACGCERPGQSSGTGGYNPPSGYGTCPSGQYWNGGSCVSSNYVPPTNYESPEQACLRGTGCTWNGSACNCPSAQPQPTSPTEQPTSPPAPLPSPEPVPAPMEAPPPSGAASCPSGSYWNGTACVPG